MENKGTKNNCTHAQLGHLGTVSYKKVADQLPFLSFREQKKGAAPDPCTAKRAGGPPKPPFQPNPSISPHSLPI